ncbi:GGDEF domain-containing protein [Sulfurimonas paralvinellae]|uniref:GGDEF domain-containing protein n=1 Tax=Sulfurimonas paralvinellae TaxID=317658 RepID=UPI001D053005|nr:GGDEF domain-containing protein [Sulfurimonas paralvinellae]
MEKDNAIFKIITNETRESTEPMEIVTPTIYASVFSKFADKHDLSLENEEEISHNILKDECSFLTELQTKTSENANRLSKNTKKAINAIKDKNDTLLNEVLHETEALRLEVEKLRESVYKDELTHVYNRKWLHDNCMQTDKESFNQEGVLAMIDLNYFKLINDTYGHVIGDKVLIFIANRLKSINKNVIRYGGDEFIILFPKNSSIEHTRELLDRTRESVLSKKLKAHEEMFTLSFSFGVASFKSGNKLAKVLEDADKSMYNDKINIKKRITGI